ncbi:P1 family peptidase [Salinibacter altiplanensis]|uniref:DmpA family aminopeptidase n=1 Tax=Salinibacter altiplanensis TaxID=1803181 RepID=UPI000C9EEFB8|nr:P1 family peptidase [Salinibacter altiplanensis]
MSLRWLAVSLLLCIVPITGMAQSESVRVRDLGLAPGLFGPGPHNALTDVAGVQVGHRTLVEGDSVRTGVTAIRPHGGDLFHDKVPAAVHVGNGFGKAAGVLQVQELGTIETPIVLTNTLDVGTAVAATVDWMLDQPGNEEVSSVNAVVGETNDGVLNDIRGQHVTGDDVVAAIESASGGPVAEGSVGAGTGTRALGWKGGIGTSSRLLPDAYGAYTVGALVQANYGGVLRIDGVPVGERLGRYDFRSVVEETGDEETPGPDDAGSCMIVLATDAPVSPRNLERMARRAMLGLARTGSYASNGSGDFVVAFSTQNRRAGDAAPRPDSLLRNARMSPLFLATVEATEEAVYNALTAATTVTGRDGHTQEALPLDRLRAILRDAGRIDVNESDAPRP